MPEALPYGYWTFGNQNGLYGAESTVQTLSDGRKVIRKDPDYPSVLEDEFILFAVKNDLNARHQFLALLPTMDPVSQQRLNNLMAKYPNYFLNDLDDLTLSDNIQRKQVTSGIYLEKPKPT